MRLGGFPNKDYVLTDDAKRGKSHVIASAVYSIHLAIMSHAPPVNNISAPPKTGEGRSMTEHKHWGR